MKFSVLPQCVSLMEFLLDLFCTVVFKGKNSADMILRNVRLHGHVSGHM